MEVHLDLEEAAMARRDRKGKRRRPQGRIAAAPAEVATQTGRVLAEREAEWLDRLARDPAGFAAVEREVHDQARHQADLYVAGLLAKAGERLEMAQHAAAVTAAAEVPLRPVEKKLGRQSFLDQRIFKPFEIGSRVATEAAPLGPDRLPTLQAGP
jgi:hypothetical protein